MQGCIALGININASVEFVVQNYRSRRYRAGNLIIIDEEILKLRTKGIIEEDDVVLWKGKRRRVPTSFRHEPNLDSYACAASKGSVV